MGCCDPSLVEILNLSGTPFTIRQVSDQVGTLDGLAVGTAIPDQGFALGYARSGPGTKGRTAGFVVVQSATGLLMQLDYAFAGSNDFGDCPCTAGNQAETGVGPFIAKPTLANGANGGEASTVWVITSQPT